MGIIHQGSEEGQNESFATITPPYMCVYISKLAGAAGHVVLVIPFPLPYILMKLITI